MTYDAIIIGGGHNGLVTAAYLSRAGKKVLVLERRAVPGGLAAGEETFPGCNVDIGPWDAGLFLPQIIEELRLTEHEITFIEPPVAAHALLPGGDGLTLWRDASKSIDELHRRSPKDADRLPDFIAFTRRAANVLRSIMTLTPPDISELGLADGMPWLKPALKLKGLGERDMMEFLRVLPLPVEQFLDEWFEDEALKGMLATSGVIGTMQGPKASSTTLIFLYHYLGGANGGFRSTRRVAGGVGTLSNALLDVAKSAGTEIRLQTEVTRIALESGQASGVVLANGEEIRSRSVVSGLDPRRTFFELVGAPTFSPEFNRKVLNIRYRATTSRLHLLLDGLPELPGGPERFTGNILICPNTNYLERAYDDAKYGRVPQNPVLDATIPTLSDQTLAPKGKHLMSISIQYTPLPLHEGDWQNEGGRLSKRVLAQLDECLPGLTDRIEARHLISPVDWEHEYGLTGGDLLHGQMAFDQLLFMRPVSGFGRYSTPVANLFLCGAGTHPGGGITGGPGYNAAREILKRLK